MTTPPTTSPTRTPREGRDRAAASAGRRADADRRHKRVLATITAAINAGTSSELSAAAVARAAGVHRSYLYRHPELLDLLHQAAPTPPSTSPDGDHVTAMSLRADLAHARDRARRVEDDNRALRRRLSEALGEQVWAETGLGPLDESVALRAEVEQLRQQLNDLGAELDERAEELDACRGANRELMARLNGPR